MPGNSIALGLPKGFNKPGPDDSKTRMRNTIDVRFWATGAPEWDHLNIPVWAMIEDGYLFVRTYCPRVNRGFVDVVNDDSFDPLPPTVLNVREFIDDID